MIPFMWHSVKDKTIKYGEEIGSCQRLGLGVGVHYKDATMGIWGEGDETILYLDCDGDYTSLYICLTSEPCKKKEWISLHVNFKINVLRSTLPSIVYLTRTFF